MPPHTESPTVSSQQFTILGLSDHSSNPELPLSMHPASRRDSIGSTNQGSMLRTRANSIASVRRSSRAGSRQSGVVLGQDGDPTVALPGDEFDFGFDPNDPANAYIFEGIDYNAVGIMDDFTNWFDANAFQLLPADGFDPNVAQVPYIEHSMQQFQAVPDPILGGGIIDPQLLNQQATPGLTAVPGAADFTPVGQYPQPLFYPEPDAFSQQQPYFYPPGYRFPVPVHVPIEQPTTRDNAVLASKSNKRVRSDSDSDDDTPLVKRRRATQSRTVKLEDDSDNDSEGDSDCIKVLRPTQVRKHDRARRESRDSGVSSSSSLGRLTKPVVPQIGEKPTKCENRPWIRINNHTKGETTRTARINGDAIKQRRYKAVPLPHGDWESRKYTFKYSHHNSIDEFKVKKMPPRQIMEYITQYPSDDLRLWIQVAPADTARRYASIDHSKCLFEDCPKYLYGDSGTIDVGHYRVAFDEKYKQYGNKVVDPFDCPGFVHLYCLERFCDFEAICKVADVQVDTRVDLPRETLQAKWTMSGRAEAELAQYFIKACKKGKLRQMKDFEHYPAHASSVPKQFDSTLVNALSEINLLGRTRSQMRQFLNRKITPNVFIINKGDMELAMTQKKIKRSKVYRRAIRHGRDTAETFDFAALYDKYNPVINQRIAECQALKARFDAEDAAGTRTRKTKGKAVAAPRVSKRKLAARHVDTSDSDSDGDQHANKHDDSDTEDLDAHPISSTVGPRSSPRKRQLVNYALDTAEPHLPSTPTPLPLTPLPLPPSSPYLDPSYVPAHNPRRTSLSTLFPTDTNFLLDDYPSPDPHEPTLNQSDVDNLKAILWRRKSSTLSNGPLYTGNVTASPALRSPRGMPARNASFADQPVSASKVFGRDDPPSRVAAAGAEEQVRRSKRLGSRLE
jgi:hypothetical protein